MKRIKFKNILFFLAMLPVVGLNAKEENLSDPKPYPLTEAEAKKLLSKNENVVERVNSFELGGFSMEFDTDRLKYDQIEIKTLADPRLNLYGYVKQDLGGNFGSRARIVFDSVVNSKGEDILDARTNRKHMQGIGFSEKNGEYRAFRKVFLQEGSDFGEQLKVEGTLYFSLPVDWKTYTLGSFDDLSNVETDPNIDSVDTSFSNSVIFKTTGEASSIQVVLMSYDLKGERIKAVAMSPSTTSVSYTWNKDAPEFQAGYVCVAGNRVEVEVPFSLLLSTNKN